MTPLHRYNAVFFASAGVLFVLACYALTQFYVHVVFWQLGNCGTGTGTACRVVAWFIDYWWVPFIAVTLAAAIAGRALYFSIGRRKGVA